MFDAFGANLAETIQTNLWLAPFAAFAGGLLTAANPCVLAMVPLMVGYVGGQKASGMRRSFLLSLTFSFGLSVMFAVLFAATWAASSLLKANWWTYVAATVCLLMGLHMLGALTISIPAPRGFTPKRQGFIGAFLLGLLFGVVSLPCAGPVLAALLTVVPLVGITLGFVLLLAYSLGHCGLVLVGGTSMGLVQRMVDSKGWTHGLRTAQKGAGVLIIMVGLLLLI